MFPVALSKSDTLALGITAFTDTAARAASGDFLNVPVLAGTTANEGDIFVVIGELLEIGDLVQPVTDILSSIFTLVSFLQLQHRRQQAD